MNRQSSLENKQLHNQSTEKLLNEYKSENETLIYIYYENGALSEKTSVSKDVIHLAAVTQKYLNAEATNQKTFILDLVSIHLMSVALTELLNAIWRLSKRATLIST